MIQHHKNTKHTWSNVEVMFNNENIALPKRDSAVPSAPCKCWTLLRSFFGFPGAVKWALDCGPHNRWDDPSRTADLLPSFTPWPLAGERFTSDPEAQSALLLVGRVRHLHVLPPEELGFRDPERVERGAENHAIIVICLPPPANCIHYPTLHYATLHCTTFHYITLHYVPLRYLTYIHKYIDIFFRDPDLQQYTHYSM